MSSKKQPLSLPLSTADLISKDSDGAGRYRDDEEDEEDESGELLSSEKPLSSSSSSNKRHRSKRSKMQTLFLCCLACLAILSGLLVSLLVTSNNSFSAANSSGGGWLASSSLCKPPSTSNEGKTPLSGWDLENEKLAVVKPNVTTKFRDALVPGSRYITSFVIAGWTNDVISYGHLIQLALLTDRIPIIPPFAPSHIGRRAGLIPFGTVFDVPRLSQAIHKPILEWSDIKNVTAPIPNPNNMEYKDYYGGDQEELGCWTLWMTQYGRGAIPREGMVPEMLSLQISWTPVPWGHGVPRETDLDYNIHYLANLGWKLGREDGLKEAKERYIDNVKKQVEKIPEEQRAGPIPDEIPVRNSVGSQVDPDDQVLCFDYLYYVATHASWEMWDESTPVWHLVGRHMHWSQHMLTIATEYLHKVFSTDSSQPLPPFISVHIRRADFSGWCYDVPKQECLAPLSAYAKRVEEVKEELFQLHPEWRESATSLPVIVMTDEPRVTPENKEGYTDGESEAWWNETVTLGWKNIDHSVENTKERYGTWYESILDAVMLSMATGYVGTDRSTYSLLAKRRVEEWQKGPTRMVKWGRVGADNHKRDFLTL